MGLDIVDQIKQAVSGGYDSSSGSGSNSSVSIGRDSGGGRVDTSGGSSSNRNNPLVTGGLHSDISRQSSSRDNSAYWSGEREERHNVNPLYSAASNAYQNYQDAVNARDNYIYQNSGNVLDEGSRYYYEQDLAKYNQRVADAERTRDMFTPSNESYAPTYKSSDELNGTSSGNSFQLNPPIMSGNDPTLSVDGVYGTPRTSNPNMPSTAKGFSGVYGTPKTSNPVWGERESTETAYFKGNRETPVDPYIQELQNARDAGQVYGTPRKSNPNSPTIKPDEQTEYYPWEKPEQQTYEQMNHDTSAYHTTRGDFPSSDNPLFPSGRLESEEGGYVAPGLQKAADFVGDVANAADSLYSQAKADAYDNMATDAAALSGRNLDYELNLYFDTFMAYAEDPSEWGKAYEDALREVLQTADLTFGSESGTREFVMSKIEEAQNAYKSIASDTSLSDGERQQRLDGIKQTYLDSTGLTVPDIYPYEAEADSLRAHARDVSPALVKEPQQLTPELEQAKQELVKAIDQVKDPELKKLLEKYTDSQYNDTFFGKIGANFGSGEINELANQAMFALAQAYEREDKDLQDYIDIANTYNLLSQYFNAANQTVLQDTDTTFERKLAGISQYLPQFREQTKSRVLPVIVGGGLGFLAGEVATPIPVLDGLIGAIAGVKGAVGGVIAGAKIGNVAGSVPYSYETMYGAAVRNFLDKGVSIEKAIELAKDEAVLSSLVESGDTLLDTMFLVPGVGSALKSFGSKFALKGFAKGIASFLGSGVSEGNEEGIQEILSIANERRANGDGNTNKGWTGLLKEAYGVITDVLKNGENADVIRDDEESGKILDRLKQNWLGGWDVGMFMNTVGGVINNTLTGPLKENALVAINDLDTNKTRAAINEGVLDGTVSEENAEAWNKLAKGKTEDQFVAGIDAFNDYAADNFVGAKKGDVLLDADNNEIGTVTKADGKGLTVEVTGADGNTKTDTVTFVGNNGFLDPESDLAKALGDGGAIVDAEEAKVFAQEAAAKRKAEAQTKAEASGINKAEGKEPPAPKANPSTKTSQQSQPKAETPRKTSGEERAEEQAPPAPKAAAVTLTNPLVQEERSTSGEERAEQQAPEAPKSKADKVSEEPAQQRLSNPNPRDLTYLTVDELFDRKEQIEEFLNQHNRWGDDGEVTRAAKEQLYQLNAEIRSRSTSTAQASAVERRRTSSQKTASEGSESASPETGNSVPAQAQESTDTANETLNAGSGEESAKSDDFRLREFGGYDIQASKDDPTLGMRVDNTTGKRTKVPRTTVAAEVVQNALYGDTVDKSISNYEGTLTEEEVNKLNPRQVIQRLQNYARKARTSLRGLIRHVAEDEAGISDRSLEHTRQFIEENVSGNALNASGEFEDEVDVLGGEDDTRKERTKQSVEEAQEEANEVRKAHLELLGDAIGSSLKSSEHSKYPTGIDGIADQILDSRSKDGIIYTAEQHDAFKQLLKDTINKEWRKQNGYPKDKKGNPKDANFKKLTIAEILDILDNALAETADLDNLSNEEFTEIDALLQRVDDMRVGYGSKKGSSSHVYTGYQDLRDILEGRSQFTQDLKGAIYDEANLTGGEQWVTDEDGNEVKISDAEGWRENPRYENDTTDYDDGKSYIEQYEDEQAYIESQLRGWVNNTYAQRSEQTGKGSGAIETIMPTVVNGKTNPRLTGDEVVRKNIQTYTSQKGINYIIQVGENMFRHFVDSDMSPKIKSVIDSHRKQASDYRNSIKSSQQYVDTLKAEIADRQARLDSLKSNPLSANTLIGKTIPWLEKAISDLTSRVQSYEKGIATTQKKLAIEEEWLNKVEKGFDKGKGKNESYTLKDFLNDKTKDIRGKDLITQEEKDSIGIKTFIDPKTGFREPVYGGFKFNALANAEPRTLAKEVIDFIKEGVEDGTLTEQGYFPAGETAQLSNGTGVVVSESGQYTNNGYYGELSPADARAEAEELSNSRLRGDSNWLGENDTGADGRLSGEQGAEGQGSRSSEAALLRSDAQVVADEYNNSPVTQINVLGRSNGKITTGTVSAKEIATGYYITGDASALDSSEYTDEQTKSQAKLCEDAAIELNTSVVTYKGGLYRDIGNGKTKRIWGFARPDGTIVIPSFKDAATNRAAAKTTAHELTHQYTEEVFDDDGQKLVSFVKGVFKKAGIDFDLMADILRPIYGNFNTVFGTGDAVISDEIVAYLMEGSTLDGALDMDTVATLRNALLSTEEFSNLDQKGYSAYGQLCNVASAALAGYGRSDPGKAKGFSLLQQSQEQRDANALYNATAWKQGNTEQRIDDIRFANSNPTGADYNALPYQYRNEARTASTRYGDVGLKSAPTESERKVGENKRDLGYRFRDFASDNISPMDDESFQNLIDQENAYNNAALGEGAPIDQSGIDTLVNEASADEEALLNSRGGNVSAEDTGRFNNLVDQASASERETLNDLRNNSEDITNASEGSFDNLVETENESVENALNEAAESSANQYPERRFKDAKDYYGKAYDEVVSKVATKHARANSRSSFTHEDIYNKLYGNTPNARNNFRRLQKLNTNIDSLLKGKMSAQAFNGFIKNMMGEQGIGQIVNDDIQREFSELAKLEEKATGGDQRESDVINFQYAAADAVAHLCARMDMVEKTERARAKLDTLAKEHGKTTKNAIGNALDWYNRMQITGDNFWRMAGNWDAASRNQGYALAQEHNKAIATRISEEAKLKDYFSGIDKNSKQFRDFANGTTMSNVDFEGHKISLMEAVKFVKICDTMRAFANENRRPDWQRVAALGGFAFEGKDGKPVFVDIQGSKKNGGAERVQWVQDHYDAAMAEIQANKAASEYMKACEEMYWDASQTAEKVHSKVNGFERYMYGKGKYTDIHYASKDGAVDFSYKDRDAIDVHDTGIMQKRTRVNGGYVICNPMSRSIDAYISQISNYIAFEEFGQKLGVLNDSKSINGNYANTVGDAYGSQYSKWFDNYVKSMTLYRETDPTKLKDKALAKARQAMMSGALVGSVSVPIKQVSSFFDTIGMVDPMAVAKAFGKNPLGLKQKGINNYLYKSRGQSISDPDFAELFGKNGLLGKIGNNPVIKLAKSATNMMDEKAVSNVYMACVYDTEMNTMPADKLYKNGKNFNDGLTTEGQFYVDSKFEQVLLGTQPIFTPQARNELARTDNQWLRMLQTFRTQQTQNYNRMLQTWNEYQAADGSTKGEAFNKFAQTMGGQVLASASLAALTAIANGVLHKHRRYKDDDDELDEEKFGKKFLYGMVESMTGNALFAGDITKWAIDAYNKRTSGNWDWRYSSKEGQYFSLYNRGINVPILSSGAVGTALQVISSAINLYDDVQKNGWDDTNILSARYLAGNMTTALGVPANNVYNALNAGYQWYNDLAYKITGDKKYEHKYDDFITQYIKVDNNQQNRLVNAILSNNTDKIDDMFENMGQDKFANTVYYGALDRYKSGKIDRDEYIDMLVDYGGKTYKDAVKDVDKKINLIESGISQYNGIDGRDGRKAFYDQYSDNFKSKDAFKQFFTDVKDGKAEGKHHSYYTTWNGQQQEVTANQCSIIDRMNENMAAGNFDYDTAKLLWENYYGYSTYKGGAWQYVGKW